MTQATQTKCRPILFSGEMVRAILDGKKTQDRRVVPGYLWQPKHRKRRDEWWYAKPRCRGRYLTNVRIEEQRDTETDELLESSERCLPLSEWMPQFCAIGQPGDTLRVKEPFRILSFGGGTAEIVYEADRERRIVSSTGMQNNCGKVNEARCPPSARRLTLQINDVRVERVQDISDEDILAEGVRHPHYPSGSVGARFGLRQAVFPELWDSLNGTKPGCSWEDDPYVWALTFHRIDA